MVNALQHKYSSQYASTPWTTWKVDGVTAGQFKNAGSFSYVRVYRFVPQFEVSPFKLTSLFSGLVTWFPLTPSETYHMGGMHSPCSTRRCLANRSPRPRYGGRPAEVYTDVHRDIKILEGGTMRRNPEPMMGASVTGKAARGSELYFWSSFRSLCTMSFSYRGRTD